MTDVLADWPHLHRAGSPDRPVLLMLHGTGGSELDIAPLAAALDPAAEMLAPRGRVSENGLNRYFRRLAEGVFDVDDVVLRSGELADFISAARAQYAFGERPVIAVGLSNGANIALATALLHPDALAGVIAFSGMFPLDDRPLESDLAGTDVLLLNGASDPMAPSASVDRVYSVLGERGAAVTIARRPGGHGIAQQDLDAAGVWLAAR